MLFALGLLLTTVVGVSAHGNGNTGAHDHGQAFCYSGMIVVKGPHAESRSSGQDPFAVPGSIYYRAHLYKWNGSSWVINASAPWKQIRGSGDLPSSYFTKITRGYWAVSVEMLWYSGNGAYLGKSPNAFVDSHKVMPFGKVGAYCAYV